MLGSLGDCHVGIPEKGIKTFQVTKLSRTTSELVETKTETDYEVHQYLACTAAVQTSLDEDVTTRAPQVPPVNPASHIRVKHSHFEEATFETAIWDLDYAALAEHIVDDVEFETYLDEYTSATEYDDDPNRCLVQLFNFILDLALRRVAEDHEPPIRMRAISQALPIGPSRPAHPVCFATAQRDNSTEAIHGWSDALFLIELQASSNHVGAPDVKMLGPDARAVLKENGPAGTEPQRRHVERAASELLTNSGIHHPRNAPTDMMAACALETFGALGNRRHLLGVSVSELQGRFWYFDRAGTVSTEEIDISDISFVGTMLRMFFATPYHLGFEKGFAAPLTELPDTASNYNMEQAQTWPHFNDVEGYRVVLTGHTFVLDCVLHSSRCLYGRGTVVYAAHAQPPLDLDMCHRPPDEVILKFSWMPVNHPDEGDLFKLANGAGVEGIPELWVACHMQRLSRSTRGRLVDSSQYEDRELRVQVMTPVCLPLHQLSNAFEFKRAFISLVMTHRQLYERARILHGDISLRNLMANSSDHSRGVLVDLDMARRVDTPPWCDPYGTEKNKALLPCGPAAFRALDLLREDPPRQVLYRHDLESFLYVLVWLVTQYEGGHPVVPPYMDISGWCLGEGRHRSDVYDAKKAFLADPIPQGLSCEHKLTHTWLPGLCQMFHAGYAAWDVIRDHLAPAKSAAASFDVETLGGHVTYEKFMAILAGH